MAFERFFNAHMRVWTGISRQVMRRWRSRAEIDDVLQEVRLRVWRKMSKFDPLRGKSFRDYIGFQARDAAKTWVHAERGANKHGTRDKNPTRRFLPVSALGREGGDEREDRWDVPVEATQERTAIEGSIAARCRTRLDRQIVEAMVAARGCVDTVVRELFGEMDASIAKKLVLGSLVEVGLEANGDERAA